MSIKEYATTTERKIATNVIKSALKNGWAVSVRDSAFGEGEYTVKRSTNLKIILDALATTDSDALTFRDPASGDFRGWVMMIWGNDGDLIHDYSEGLTINDDGYVAIVFEDA